jgi:hypothetical protein
MKGHNARGIVNKELSKRVQGLAVKLPKELREMVLGASVEAVREFIPFGKGRITEKQDNPFS